MEKGKKNPHFGQNSRTCTGTGQSCTGTGQSCTGIGSVQFFCIYQCLYFGHNLLISDPIRVIQTSRRTKHPEIATF